MKKPAHRGATAGLSKAAVAACFERYASEPHHLQALLIARRYGVPAAHAAILAELAYPAIDNWRGRP